MISMYPLNVHSLQSDEPNSGGYHQPETRCCQSYYRTGASAYGCGSQCIPAAVSARSSFFPNNCQSEFDLRSNYRHLIRTTRRCGRTGSDYLRFSKPHHVSKILRVLYRTNSPGAGPSGFGRHRLGSNQCIRHSSLHM